MKLNPDCVRDIMLTTEDLTGHNKSFCYPSNGELFSRLAAYPLDEVMYHIKQCSDASLIEGESLSDDSVLIEDLTPSGHEFLANIRSDTTFTKAKDVCKELGISSLKGITQVAANITTLIIKAHFGLS